MSTSEWIAAQYRFGGDLQILSIPIFGEMVYMSNGEVRFYAGGGPSYFLPDQTFTVLKIYLPKGPKRPDAEVLAAEIQCARDYPVTPMEIKPRMDWNSDKGMNTENIEGWLAPDGTYYGHSLGLHHSTAYHLALQIYGDPEGADHLRDLGWLSLHDGGFIRKALPATPVQMEALRLMANGVQDPKTRRHLLSAAEPD